MSATPKTIQIYLPGGDPRGIRVAEITTRIVQVIEVPRSLLADFLSMPEAGQVALYFLFGEGEDETDARVYIGQTGDLPQRLTSHNKNKDFWQRALILIVRANTMTQTHGLFLEWHALQTANKAGRYIVENGNAGTKPHTPPPLQADCLEIFETGQVLLATLGYPVFDAVSKSVDPSEEQDVFYCKGSGADGRGIYTSEGFVVFKGSSGRVETAASFATHSYAAMREDLVSSGICVVQGDRIVFQKDHLFSKPSKASVALQGRASNGWVEWKNKDGKTLDELKRQQPEGQS